MLTTPLDQDKFTALINAAVDGIVIINHAGIIETVNAATLAMFGYTEEEIVKQNVSLLMPSPDREQHDTYLKNYLSKGTAKIIGIGRDVMAQRKDGSQFPVHLSVGKFTVQGAIQFVGILSDQSARKTAEVELEQLRKYNYHQDKIATIGTLASGILHEVNNPLAAISGIVHELQWGEAADDLPESAKNLLTIVQENIERITNITREVSDLSTPSSNHVELYSLNELIERTLRLLRFDKNNHDIDFVTKLSPDIPAIEGVPDHITQVLFNLLVNAIDACHDSKPMHVVEIATEMTNQAVLLTIHDNGTGIRPEHLNKVNEPFFSTKPPGKGTGLGLSLCHSLLKEEGGKLEIDSTFNQDMNNHSEKSHGTTVKVWLPQNRKN